MWHFSPPQQYLGNTSIPMAYGFMPSGVNHLLRRGIESLQGSTPLLHGDTVTSQGGTLCSPRVGASLLGGTKVFSGGTEALIGGKLSLLGEGHLLLRITLSLHGAFERLLGGFHLFLYGSCSHLKASPNLTSDNQSQIDRRL
jgi:hypothetical protein